MTAATWYMCSRRVSLSRSALKALLHKEKQIVESVAPWVQFNLAQTRRVKDRNLREPDARIFQRLDLDLLRERHAVRCEPHFFQDRPPEHPHAGLRIAHPAEKQDRHGKRQNPVPHLVLETHGLPIAHRKTRSVQKIYLEMQQRFDQIRDRVRRITVVAIERYDDVAGGRSESTFVRAAVTAHLLADHLRSELVCHLRRPVLRAVVHHDYLVHEVRHARKDLLDSLLFV